MYKRPVELDGDPVDKTFMDEVVYMLALEDKLENMPNNLSGGQQQQMCISDSLMSNDLLRPDCYFLLENNSINAISELTEKERRQAHNLQKMYKAGAFNGR